MKITEYYDVYVRFLAKIEDEYLASLKTEEELHVALYPLLLSAINSFARISEHNLRKRDERAHVFYETLSDDEIEVLAICMKPVWLERYINSSRKIEQQYYDAGIKTYSPNENLRNLTTLYQQYLADMRKALTEYTYKRVSIVGNFGGLEKYPAHKDYVPGPTIHNGDENDPIYSNENNE
jgi:hypothetical protein